VGDNFRFLWGAFVLADPGDFLEVSASCSSSSADAAAAAASTGAIGVYSKVASIGGRVGYAAGDIAGGEESEGGSFPCFSKS